MMGSSGLWNSPPAAVRWCLKWGCIAAAGLVAGALAAAIALGMCTTIPERRAQLCEMLGYATDDCTPQRQGGTLAEVIVSVDDGVSEPDTVPSVAGVYGTSITMRIHGVTLARTYQRLDTDLVHYLKTPPCAYRECVVLRGAADAGGPTEADLLNLPRAADKLMYQWPDSAFLQDLLTIMHAPPGAMPVITAVRKVVAHDATGRPGATTIAAKVRIELFLPAP